MVAGFLLAAAALLNLVRAQAPAAKPNILFIMGDDMRPYAAAHHALGHYLGQLG